MRRPRRDPVLSDTDGVASEPGRGWIRLATHVELLAPEDVSVDELARADDAAAEWFFQRSLHRTVRRPRSDG